MKTTRTLLRALLALLFISLSGARASAQDVRPLPPGLSESSSLAEILDWLNRNAFARARIGLEGYRLNSLLVSDVTRGGGPLPEESAVFAPGFKLASADGCRLRLRNDAIKVLRPGGDAAKYDPGRLSLYVKGEPGLTPDPADLYIWLNRLRPEGETPYLHTRDAEKGRAFGWWRTVFEQKRVRKPDVVVLEIPERRRGEGPDQFYARKVSFTFDDADSGGQFYQAFSRAVTLCAGR